MTFPGSSDNKTQIVGGAKVLYVSADGNWLVGGSATGTDMFFGFRAPSGTSSNSLLSGTYFTAGMEDYVASPPNFLDAFYGSINTSGNGTLISHERIDDVVDIITYDNTFNTSVTIGADGILLRRQRLQLFRRLQWGRTDADWIQPTVFAHYRRSRTFLYSFFHGVD